jgi:hypothetical protein
MRTRSGWSCGAARRRSLPRSCSASSRAARAPSSTSPRCRCRPWSRYRPWRRWPSSRLAVPPFSRSSMQPLPPARPPARLRSLTPPPRARRAQFMRGILAACRSHPRALAPLSAHASEDVEVPGPGLLCPLHCGAAALRAAGAGPRPACVLAVGAVGVLTVGAVGVACASVPTAHGQPRASQVLARALAACCCERGGGEAAPFCTPEFLAGAAPALLAHRLSIATADGAHGARRAAGVDEHLAFLEGVVRAAPLPV